MSQDAGTAATYGVDPARVADAANNWAKPLIESLADGFVSLYLYGSAVDPGFDPKHSDVNLLLIARALPASTIRALSEVWPGGGPTDYAAFYSYAYPVPEGFAEQAVRPAAAFFSEEAGEFILPYDAVRTANDPDATLFEFLTSTYEAAATTANWDRSGLECATGEPRVVRAL